MSELIMLKTRPQYTIETNKIIFPKKLGLKKTKVSEETQPKKEVKHKFQFH